MFLLTFVVESGQLLLAVIALYLRSNLQAETCSAGVISEGQYESSLLFSIFSIILISEGEIDYVKILNKVLPRDIRIIGWSPVPGEFHARY
ncbi:tRNA pseudouridine(38/39) synthase [Bienertia sinuspersici]